MRHARIFIASRNVPTLRVWAFVCLFFTFSDGMWAQESSPSKAPSSDWTNVIAIDLGSNVQIDLTSRQRAIGHLVSVTADGVTLSVRRTDTTIPRKAIRRVTPLGDRMTARSAKRGFIIGAVAGGLMALWEPRATACHGGRFWQAAGELSGH